jgi:hypothetical protein
LRMVYSRGFRFRRDFDDLRSTLAHLMMDIWIISRTSRWMNSNYFYMLCAIIMHFIASVFCATNHMSPTK